MLVHDFAYADIAFDGHQPPSVLAAEGALDCAVELYSLTKSFSMAGWRMGFTLGRPDVVAALAKLKSYLDYGTFQPIQIASIVALREAPDYPAEVCEIYRGRRDALIAGLARAGWDVEPPQGHDVRLGADPRAASASSAPSSSRSSSRARPTSRSARASASASGGDGHVRFALVENEQRIGQATRSIRKLLRHEPSAHGRRPLPSEAELTRGRVLREARPSCSAAPAASSRRGAGRARRRGRRGRGGALSTSSTIGSPSRTRGDRAAAGRLGRDVADHQAVRRAREAAVGDQRDLVAEPLADERRGDVQHLAHARARRPGPRSGSRPRRPA